MFSVHASPDTHPDWFAGLFSKFQARYLSFVPMFIRLGQVTAFGLAALLAGLCDVEARRHDILLTVAFSGFLLVQPIHYLLHKKWLSFVHPVMEDILMERPKVENESKAILQLLHYPLLSARWNAVLTVLFILTPGWIVLLARETPMSIDHGLSLQVIIVLSFLYVAVWDLLLTERMVVPVLRFLSSRPGLGQLPNFPTMKIGLKMTTIMGLLAVVLILAFAVWTYSGVGTELARLPGRISSIHLQSILNHLLAGFFTLALVLALLIAGPLWYLAKSLNVRVGHLLSRVTNLHEAESFESHHNGLLPDELGQLNFRLRNAMSRIHDKINYLQKTGNDLFLTTKVISDIASVQNSSLVRQSTSVTQTSSTLEEMAVSSGQIAENANSVVSLAEDTEKHAERGLDMMADTVARIGQVREHSQLSVSEIITLSEQIQEIEQVLNLINSIATETNLIAFNAAIEASAAGESGRRFKVVASEVRDLSDRVTRSIDTVQNVIKRIQDATSDLVILAQGNSEMIEEGVNRSQNTYVSLKEILEWARRSAEAAKQIYVAIQQQRVANKQIAISFSEISNEIRELAMTAESYGQHVQNLKRFAGNIDAVTQFFKPSHPNIHEPKDR